MSKKYATPLLLEIRPSRRMTAWLVLTHALALLMLVVLGVPVLPGAGAAVAILFSLNRAYRLHARRRHPGAVCRLVWEAGATCRLTRYTGIQEAAILQPRAFVMPWLVVLHLKLPAGKSVHLPLLPDMLEHEALRRLRVRLMIELQQSSISVT